MGKLIDTDFLTKLSFIEQEYVFRELLGILTDDQIKNLLKDYIDTNMKHQEYIRYISDISADYIKESEIFIEQFKRNVNALYMDKQLNHNIFSNIDIDETNWFWYARLLEKSEDTKFPKRNYFKPTYLVERLYKIVKDLSFENNCLDEELYRLQKVVINLHNKEVKDNDNRA